MSGGRDDGMNGAELVNWEVDVPMADETPETPTRHTCILDDGGTAMRKCYACEAEKANAETGLQWARAAHAAERQAEARYCDRCDQLSQDDELICVDCVGETLERHAEALRQARDAWKNAVIDATVVDWIFRLLTSPGWYWPVVGTWHTFDLCWMECGHSSILPTHWMALATPPSATEDK